MTKRLLFSSMIGLIFQTCALAQSGYGFSSIYVDSGSGNITVEG